MMRESKTLRIGFSSYEKKRTLCLPRYSSFVWFLIVLQYLTVTPQKDTLVYMYDTIPAGGFTVKNRSDFLT